EGLDVGRVLADRIDQRVGGDLFGAAQLDRLARGGRPGLDRLGAVTLGQHHAVIKSLRAAGAAGGPGNPAVAVLLVDADAVVIGNETLVEADEFLIERWNEQLRLYRNPAVGAEFHLRVQAPYIVGFVFPDGDVQDIDLITGNQEPQTDHKGNQDFQMRVDRLHNVLSGSFRLLLHSMDRSEKAALDGCDSSTQADRHTGP